MLHTEKIVTAAQMRAIDRCAIEQLHIPSVILMEHAAYALAEVCAPLGGSFCIVCGKGNNGGDGYALARLLAHMGKQVQVVSVFDGGCTPDAQVNYKACCACNIPMLPLEKLTSCRADVVVDAVLGTGIRGEVTGPAAAAIDGINRMVGCKVAVDVPSGFDADTGKAGAHVVKADITVTLALYKIGLLNGQVYTGKLIKKDIFIPEAAVASQNITTELIMGATLPKRAADAHKGTYGHVAVIAGSVGMAGAACMAAEGAVRGGSGLVTLLCPQSILLPVMAKLTAAMCIPVADDGCSMQLFDVTTTLSRLPDAVLFGCGVRRTTEIAALAAEVARLSCPKVFDADGLVCMAQTPHLLQGSIITPHPGEMALLTGKTVEEIQADRIGTATEYAQKWGCIVVLKGHNTVIACPDGKVYINTTGNPGMATGGSGDVLAGLIAAFLAQGFAPELAAASGVYFHGKAGDLAAGDLGEYALSATDLLGYLPKALC